VRLQLLVAKRFGRIDVHGTASGEHTGRHRDDQQDAAGERVAGRVAGRYLKQERGHKPRNPTRNQQPGNGSRDDDSRGLTQQPAIDASD
jgi:hypothetical protein